MIVSKTFKVGPSDNLSFTGPSESVPVTSLIIYGKSTQSGTPTVSDPVPIAYVASGGTLTLSVTAGGSTQTITIPASVGLKGINTSLAYKYLVGNGAYLTTQDGARLLAK